MKEYNDLILNKLKKKIEGFKSEIAKKEADVNILKLKVERAETAIKERLNLLNEGSVKPHLLTQYEKFVEFYNYKMSDVIGKSRKLELCYLRAVIINDLLTSSIHKQQDIARLFNRNRTTINTTPKRCNVKYDKKLREMTKKLKELK